MFLRQIRRSEQDLRVRLIERSWVRRVDDAP